jgi:hypothetical protein
MRCAAVDQLTGEIYIDYSPEWMKQVYENTGEEFGDSIGDYTGKIRYKINDEFRNSRHSVITYEGWELTLYKTLDKLTGEFTTKLKIEGNPSSIYHAGKNYRNIPFEEFRDIINHCADIFCLDINKIILTTPYEPSVTVTADPDVIRLNEETIRGRLITFQDRRFEIVTTSTGEYMGEVAKNTHYHEKVYLPSVKFNEANLNYLRIEAHYNRVKTFKERTGINTWGDLIKEENIHRCYQVVLEGWNDVIVYDPKLKRNKKYPDYLNEMIRKGNKADFWIKEFPLTASNKTLKKRVEEYRELSFRKGEGLHTRVRNWIIKESEKFPNLTTRLTCKKWEIENNNTDRSNQLTTMSNYITTELIKCNKKTNKEVQREKAELKEKQFKSFLKALGVTLEEQKRKGISI